MFCQSLALGLLGSRVAYALKEPYTLVYENIRKKLTFFLLTSTSFSQKLANVKAKLELCAFIVWPNFSSTTGTCITVIDLLMLGNKTSHRQD